MLYLKTPRAARGAFLVLFGMVSILPFKAMAEDAWTLEAAISQAVQSSPELHSSLSEVEAQKGELRQAGAFPNPEFSVTGSNKMGKDNGKGGSDLTQFSVTQPIPLGRLGKQTNVAQAELQAKTYDSSYQKLIQENKAAILFHRLQYSEAKLKLARERLSFANKFGQSENENDPLIRYSSELDTKRLALLKDVADQDLETARTEYQEAKSLFASFLGLPVKNAYKTSSFGRLVVPENLDDLLKSQKENHAAISAAKSRVGVADASISVAESDRYPDVGVTFFRERDMLDDRRQDFNGVMLTATIPFWDQKEGSIAKAKAQANSARHQARALERDLQSSLNESYIRLKYLKTQADTYRSRRLEPAQQVLDLAKKSFASDEVQILSLIDANNSYFDARSQYLDIQYQGWVESANLRLLSGKSMPEYVAPKKEKPKKSAKAKAKPKTKKTTEAVKENSVKEDAAQKGAQ